MQILRPYEPKLLMPVPRFEWREPSQAQPKDQFGCQNRNRFVIRGWKLDGGLIQERWYDDRDEFDHDLWRRVVEEPYADIFWEWAAVTTLTSPTGSNQTYNVPSDWNNSANSVETIGGGASGGISRDGSLLRVGTGGGGGGYGLYTNLSLTPGGTATYNIAATAAGVTRNTNGNTNGNPGNDTWFNGATYAAASVGSTGAGAGIGANSNQNGGVGGSGKGTGSYNGGRGGNVTGAANTNRHASGGGAAAGRAGAGGAGTDDAGTSNTATAGGTGDNGTGGAGSAGSSSGSSAGGAGTEMDSIGAGGASGGGQASISASGSGAGGNYGAGTGGAVNAANSCTSGTAAQGAIWVTYTPLLGSAKFFQMF